jgi:hypothetical protein
MDSVLDTAQCGGFPHSEIHGSKSARNSPWLIAACYVLHRLSVPRHPPDALRRLIRETVMRRDKPDARNFTTERVAHLRGRPHDLACKDPRRDRRNTLYDDKQPSGMMPAPRFPRTNFGDASSALPINTPRTLTGAGGGERDRTDDLLLAKQALSQLSYTPGRRAEEYGGPGRI